MSDLSSRVEYAQMYRRNQWIVKACEWSIHNWVRFTDPADDSFTVLVLCTVCGRRPDEALLELPVVIP